MTLSEHITFMEFTDRMMECATSEGFWAIPEVNRDELFDAFLDGDLLIFKKTVENEEETWKIEIRDKKQT